MPTTTAAAPLTFDAFWRFISEHRTCVVRAGAGDTVLLDHEALHWDFFEEDDGRAICQLLLGKAQVGELVIERSDVSFVQSSLDPENAAQGYWMFECMGGPKDDTYPVYHFVLTHGLEGTTTHQGLKH